VSDANYELLSPFSRGESGHGNELMIFRQNKIQIEA